MATFKSPQEILKSLDSLLAGIKWKGPPSDISHLQSSSHLASFKKLGNQEEITSRRVITQTLMMYDEKQVKGSFRVCSIGCEDGSLDRLILDGIKELNVEYVGLDNDEQMVDMALEELRDISPNINITTMEVDYEDNNALEQLHLEKFDVIWMVNCTYYATSLNSLLQGGFSLLKPSGIMLIVSSSKESVEELVTRFWFHQRQDQLKTTESVVFTLHQLGIPYRIKREPITLNLTEQLNEDFQSDESKLVLDHLVFCRLTDYPPQVRELAVKFLKSIAEINKTSSKIVSMSDLIQIRRKAF